MVVVSEEDRKLLGVHSLRIIFYICTSHQKKTFFDNIIAKIRCLKKNNYYNLYLHDFNFIRTPLLASRIQK